MKDHLSLTSFYPAITTKCFLINVNLLTKRRFKVENRLYSLDFRLETLNLVKTFIDYKQYIISYGIRINRR